MTGIGHDGAPKISIRALPFLTKAGQDRTPNMDLVCGPSSPRCYLDTFYTIERGAYYKDRLGANRNIRVTLKPA